MIRRILGGIHLTQEELEQVILTLAGPPAQDHQISSSRLSTINLNSSGLSMRTVHYVAPLRVGNVLHANKMEGQGVM